MLFFGKKQPLILRIGTVKFLNAKPLDWGFLYHYRIKYISTLKKYQYAITEDTPSRLIDALLQGQIDIGMVSSIEVLKNRSILNFYHKLGVCAKKKVQSIFYISKKSYLEPVKRVFLDISSRSSNGLLKILYFKTFREFPEFIYEKPDVIIKNINDHSSGILIGDPAIELYLSRPTFQLKDLAEWWYELTQLPFVFAVWAFPKKINFDLQIFEESYQVGSKSIKDIIQQYPFPKDFSYNYLTKNLHYQLGKEELESLNLYEKYLRELDLL
jgi:chorismate dehydratase